MTQAGIAFQRQIGIPIVYRVVRLDTSFRADLVIAERLVVEIKSMEAVAGVHEAQILTYLRLGGYRVGLLLNFNTVRLKDGLRRFVM